MKVFTVMYLHVVVSVCSTYERAATMAELSAREGHICDIYVGAINSDNPHVLIGENYGTQNPS